MQLSLSVFPKKDSSDNINLIQQKASQSDRPKQTTCMEPIAASLGMGSCQSQIPVRRLVMRNPQWYITTSETGQGPISCPIDLRTGSQAAKRRREQNAIWSCQNRKRRKEQEQKDLEDNITSNEGTGSAVAIAREAGTTGQGGFITPSVS